MKILAVESSAGPASVCLTCDGKILIRVFRNDGLTHSVTLHDMCQYVLSSTGTNAEDIDLFAVSVGPGSFTGLRIGIATVKGLAWATEKPCAGVSTLLGMAMTHPEWRGLIAPAMDARRSQVYTALFRSDKEGISRISPDTACSVSEAADQIPAGEPVLVCGDGAELLYRELIQKGFDAVLAPIHSRYQSADGIALAAPSVPACSSSDLMPNYLRKSQAEREKEEREKASGSKQEYTV